MKEKEIHVTASHIPISSCPQQDLEDKAFTIAI